MSDQPQTAQPAQTAQPVQPAQPVQTAQTAQRFSRRTLLRRAAVGSAVSGAALALVPPGAAAQSPAQSPAQPVTAAMRSSRKALQQVQAALGAPSAATAPAPEIVALNRMGFGPRPGDVDALLALGATSAERIAAYVEQQLNPAAIDDSECDGKLAALNLTTLNKSRAQLWQDHVRKEGIDWYERTRPAEETTTATFVRALYSKRQLVEVLADFWHNHFNVFGYDYWTAPVFVQYDRDVIRANLLGNFRTLLGAVANSPAMLYYLDNVSNTSGGPNENYARETFELHTLGAMNYLGATGDPDDVPRDGEGRPVGYLDTDVYQATRAFTGWRIDEETGEFWFDDSVHDKYSKTVLGVRLNDFLGEEDGRTVLDLLASHPGTARHIATKLCRRLISDNPPPAVVEAAAAVFGAQRDAPDQLKQVVRTILLAPEFAATWGEKIKRPFEYVASLLRAGQADFAPDDGFFWMFGRIGQPLFQWQPPNGFPDLKEDWSSTMPMLGRWRMCNWLIDSWRYDAGPQEGELRMELLAQMPGSVRTPAALVDWWAQRILGRDLPAAERTPIVDFMAYGRNPAYDLPAEEIADRLRFMVGLIFMSPSFQWR